MLEPLYTKNKYKEYKDKLINLLKIINPIIDELIKWSDNKNYRYYLELQLIVNKIINIF